MIGQLAPGGAAEPFVAQLQADVGTFLGLKQRLLGARLLPVAPAQQAALQQAYTRQLELEAQLPDVTAAVARLQAGQINFTDSLLAGGFVAIMEVHLRQTQSLLAGLPAAPATTVDWGKVLLWGGGAAAAWWALKSGAKSLVWIGLAVGGYMLWRNQTPAMVQP
jgi:hypothetical protein